MLRQRYRSCCDRSCEVRAPRWARQLELGVERVCEDRGPGVRRWTRTPTPSPQVTLSPSARTRPFTSCHGGWPEVSDSEPDEPSR